jgi:hypothetical protein
VPSLAAFFRVLAKDTVKLAFTTWCTPSLARVRRLVSRQRELKDGSAWRTKARTRELRNYCSKDEKVVSY